MISEATYLPSIARAFAMLPAGSAHSAERAVVSGVAAEAAGDALIGSRRSAPSTVTIDLTASRNHSNRNHRAAPTAPSRRSEVVAARATPQLNYSRSASLVPISGHPRGLIVDIVV